MRRIILINLTILKILVTFEAREALAISVALLPVGLSPTINSQSQPISGIIVTVEIRSSQKKNDR